MLGYLVFLFTMLVLIAFGKYTLMTGFKNLTIKRELNEYAVFEGKEFKLTTIVENNKWLPISFIMINEEVMEDLLFSANDYAEGSSSMAQKYVNYQSQYSVSWYERLKATRTIKTYKRGAYIFKNIDVTIGDIFGFSSHKENIEDVVELLVYPTIESMGNFQFKTSSLQGDSIVKRWIHKDPLFIKGIREYNAEDRMKDIHWKSSLKMNKLMVKDYDFTSEKEIMFIINTENDGPYWKKADVKSIDTGIKLITALSKASLDEGVPVGLWTNAQLVSYKQNYQYEVAPSLNSMKPILNICARLCYYHRLRFKDYLRENIQKFEHQINYIIITTFLDEESIGILTALRRKGFIISIVDTSTEHDIESINGFEIVKATNDKVGDYNA